MRKKLVDDAAAGRLQLFKLFNRANKGYTHASPIPGFERQLARMEQLPEATHIGWYQFGEEMTALYAMGDTMILLDRFDARPTQGPRPDTPDLRTVLCVGGTNWEDVCQAVVTLQLDATPISEEDIHG